MLSMTLLLVSESLAPAPCGGVYKHASTLVKICSQHDDSGSHARQIRSTVVAWCELYLDELNRLKLMI